MAKSSHRLSTNGSKLYALHQLAHFIPGPSSEIAMHLNRVLRNGLSSNQCAMHLRKTRGCIITPIYHSSGGGTINSYFLKKPENAEIHTSKRKVDKYIVNLLAEGGEE